MKSKQSLGLASILASAFFYGSYGVWSRLMVGGFGEFNQAWIRAGMVLLLIIPFGIFNNSFKRIARSDWKWFAVVALAGGLNQAPYYFGFRYLDVGLATVLFYGALTIGAFLIGKFFFAEQITREKSISLVIGLTGLLVINGINTNFIQFLAALAVVVAGLMGACIVTFSKKLSTNYSETQILTSIFVCMLICNAFISLFINEPLSLNFISVAWGAQVLYALTQLAANALVIKGFSLLQPAIAALLGLTEVIFAIILGMLVFSEQLTPSIVLGSLLILTAAALPQAQAFIGRKNVTR
jgi:drug/metabolite transporter (DMT)-like permease